jgi:hypothetical protein
VLTLGLVVTGEAEETDALDVLTLTLVVTGLELADEAELLEKKARISALYRLQQIRTSPTRQ